MSSRLASITAEAMEGNKRWAALHVRASTQPRVDEKGEALPPLWSLTPWKERTIADVASLRLAEMYEAEARASKLADRPAQMAVLVIPARIEDPRAWEAKARALEGAGRIDVTPAKEADER